MPREVNNNHNHVSVITRVAWADTGGGGEGKGLSYNNDNHISVITRVTWSDTGGGEEVIL